MRLLLTPFGFGVLGCLVLAGWSLWSAGLLDGPVARDVRTSSVYAAPGIDLDEAEAERIIGNRRLVVVMLEPGADLDGECDRLGRAAAGTVALLLSPAGDDYERYGCAQLAGSDGEDLGRALAVESIIGRGVDAFLDDPLAAVKMIVLNYDLLVSAGTIPDDARTVSPSLPRYLVAAAAVLAVLIGSTVAYVAARRAGRLAARHLASREAAADSRSELSAATAVLAQQIVELDRRSPPLSGRAAEEYGELVAGYAEVLDAVTGAADPDDEQLAGLTRRVESLTGRARRVLKPG